MKQMMTGLERIRAVVAGEPCDRPPVAPIGMMFSARYAGVPFKDYCLDGSQMAACQIKMMRDFGTDFVLVCSDPAREVVDMAGEDSVRWFDDQPPAIDEEKAALKDKVALRRLRKPEPARRGRMYDRVRAVEILAREAKGEAEITGWVEGALALAAELRGINAIMTDFYDDPDFVEELLDLTADVAVEYARVQVEAGADSIGMSDAAASMIGPKLYEQFLLPRQIRILSAIRDAGAIARVHMCGCTDPLLTQMGQLPADIFELDFRTDLALARRTLGPDRVLCGNISTVGALIHGTPADVVDEARSCHGICGARHIVSPGCEMSPLSLHANVRAMVEYSCGRA